MILTAQQVKDKLGIKTTDTLKRIVATGALKPANQPAPGKKKFYMVFDSREVNDYLRRRTNGERPTPLLDAPAPPAPPAPTQIALGIISRLDAIEGKLDALLALWR